MSTFTSLKELFKVHSRESIVTLGRFIARREFKDGKSLFTVFDDINSAITFINSIKKEERSFHEVILKESPQKLKFDIDISKDDENFSSKKEDILERFLAALHNAFSTLYGIDLIGDGNGDCIVICDSCRTDKISYHIIINNFHVESAVEAAYFTSFLDKLLPAKIMDLAVNKSIQNFRIVGCIKLGAGISSIKTIKTKNKWYDSIITFITDESILLPPIAKSLSEDTTLSSNLSSNMTFPFSPDQQKKIIEFLDTGGWIDGCKFDKVVENCLLLFKRIMPGNCKICRKEHQKENSPLVVITADGTILFKCRRALNKPAKVLIHQDLSSIDESRRLEQQVSDILDKESNRHIDEIKEIAAGKTIDIYDATELKQFIPARALFVRAAMKMGKTKTLIKYLNSFYPPQSQERVVILSFRQTFSSSIKNSLNTNNQNFEMYSDFRGDIDLNLHQRIILQVESFFRLKTHVAPDLLILDESESIIEQLESGLSKNISETWAKFEWLVKYSKRIICMDAYLSRRTINVVNKILSTSRRPEEEPIIYQINIHKNSANDNYHIYTDKLQWLSSLFKELSVGKKIVLPTSSLAEAESIAAAASTKFPTKNISIFTSKTSMSEKRQAFENVHASWAGLDLLIYTPTVSAGVSFELEHFDLLYGNFINLSCPVETVMQMMGRVRNIKQKEYHLYINEERKPPKRPETAEAIEEQVVNSRMDLFGANNQIPLPDQVPLEFDETGKLIIHKTNFYTMWLENEIVRSKSRNNFTARLITIISQYGARFNIVKPNQTLSISEMIDNSNLSSMIDEQRQEIKDKYSLLISSAPDIDEEEAANIINKMQLSNGLSSSTEATIIEKASLKKFNIRKIFNVPAEEKVDQQFIKRFDKPHVKEVYKNLSLILNNGEIDNNMERLKNYSKDSFLSRVVSTNRDGIGTSFDGSIKATEQTCGEINDLRDKHNYQKHRIGLSILKEFGFKSPADDNIFGRSVIDEIVERRGDFLLSLIDTRSIYLSTITLRPNSRNKLESINQILDAIYGVKIRCRRGDNDMYELCRTNDAWVLLAKDRS